METRSCSSYDCRLSYGNHVESLFWRSFVVESAKAVVGEEGGILRTAGM